MNVGNQAEPRILAPTYQMRDICDSMFPLESVMITEGCGRGLQAREGPLMTLFCEVHVCFGNAYRTGVKGRI